MDRSTRACRICGRLIYWDHAFKAGNFRRHETACGNQPEEQRVKKRARSERVRIRARRRRRRGPKEQLELFFDEAEQKKRPK